jgi:acyl dehydratase
VAFEVRFLQAGALVATCESLYMVRRGERSAQPDLPPLAPQLDAWTVASDAGRRHAALSGDYNPVHLWDATARWFGQPRAILHGMATAARAVAALERASGKQVRGLEVEFRRPLRLPATVELGGGPGAFTVSSEAGCHLLGRVI